MSAVTNETDWKLAPRWFLISLIGVTGGAFLWTSVRWVEGVERDRDRIIAVEQSDAAQNQAISTMKEGIRRITDSQLRMELDAVTVALFEARRHGHREAVAYLEKRLRELEGK